MSTERWLHYSVVTDRSNIVHVFVTCLFFSGTPEDTNFTIISLFLFSCNISNYYFTFSGRHFPESPPPSGAGFGGRMFVS